MQTQDKSSGTKWWLKIVGPPDQLVKVSRRVHEPVKPASNNQPAHVDVPARKVGRIPFFQKED